MPAATASAQKQAVADLSAAIIAFDEDGNEITSEVVEYEDYLNALPPREDRRRFKTPRSYWEVRYPGCALQPYPRLGGFRSTESGLWSVEYPYQDQAVREHIAQNAHVDPDTLRISEDELAIMDGRKAGTIMYCQRCHFVSCSLTAIGLHETLTGHTFAQTPRRD